LTTLVHVFSGSALVNGTEAVEGQMVVLERGSGDVEVSSTDGAETLLLAGEPINEPIARYGPFVMNNREELVQAVEDYQAGRLGSIRAEGSGVSR